MAASRWARDGNASGKSPRAALSLRGGEVERRGLEGGGVATRGALETGGTGEDGKACDTERYIPCYVHTSSSGGDDDA
jgi:hypothetical protein